MHLALGLKQNEKMKFYPGQKVLCVNDYFFPRCAYPIRKGSVYTISGFYKCVCGSDQVTLTGIPDDAILMGCRCGRTSMRPQTYYSWRFIPIEYFEAFIGFSEVNKEELTESGGNGSFEKCLKESPTESPGDGN